MQTRLKEIHEYLIKVGCEEQDLLNMDTQSVYLATEIALYAHRDQKRVNGEDYANHPLNCMESYRKFVGITPDDYFCIDVDLMCKYGIPYEGVQELCLLHDVIEDSDLTFDEVRDIFIECGFKTHFDLYIALPLNKITHDKSQSYDEYIKICMEHPTSSLVKLIDMQDNLNVLTLTNFNEENYQRANKYLQFIYLINSKYHFIENNQIYLSEFAKNRD